MPKKISEAAVKRRAVSAANSRKKPSAPLAWSEAQAEAPFPSDLPPAWEAQFRRDYAARLVKLAIAKAPYGRHGRSGKGGKTELLRRAVYLSQEEIDDQDPKAKAAGLSWSAWARRRLCQ